jgi:hypothetical protein
MSFLVMKRGMLVLLGWQLCNGVAVALPEEVAGFLGRNCLECHGAEQPKAELRVDKLGLPVAGDEIWEAILYAIETGDMPPKKARQPGAAERSGVVVWLAGELAEEVEDRPIGLRRMNRVEYEWTVRDLLGIDIELADLLPEDSRVAGFDKVGDGLGISPVLLEKYLEAADAAFEGVIRRIEPLPAEVRRAEVMEISENISSVKENKGGVIEVGGSMVKFTPGWPPVRVDPAHPIEGGIYRCRVAVWPYQPGERSIAVAIYVGPLFGPGKRHLRRVFDARGTADDPRVVEFTTWMNEGDALHILPWVFPEHITYIHKDELRPGLGVKWAETYGPLDQEFPSVAQRGLFGDVASLGMEEYRPIYMRHRRGVKAQRVVSSDEEADVRRIVAGLVPRAFRRPVEGELVEPFVELAVSRLKEGYDFEDAVRAGVTAVLSSPYFLMLNIEAAVDEYAIASRLSYFLWNSLPDEELMRLAGEGKLSDPTVRRVQVERMVGDPKIERFVDHFTGQWLDLDEIDFTSPDKTLYPEFDALLQESMVLETRGFFRRILKENLSVDHFIDSDFLVLNERLARHYGIPGVEGHEDFRVVEVPGGSLRGGLLGQGSVLKVTANGTTSSPILRGVWVLDRILGQPVPPPPPGVPAVEPDIRGASSVRELMVKHTEIESCARCHDRIDPPGFAMEVFDPIGGEREWYRSLGEGERVGRTGYRVGPAVECDGELHDGRAFADYLAYREHLKADRDLVMRAVAEKLVIYGTGRRLVVGDRDVIDGVVERARAEGMGLRSMIEAVVESEIFLRR